MKKKLLFVSLLMVAVAGMTVFEVSGADAKKKKKAPVKSITGAFYLAVLIYN